LTNGPGRKHFGLVFIGLALLTLFFAAGAGVLSLYGGNSAQVIKVTDTLLDLTKLCVAGLVGLIGGKAL
jgi:hypothetical protein